MATNKFGLDASYFRSNFRVLLRDVTHYTPDEMYRYLMRLARVAKPQDPSETRQQILSNIKIDPENAASAFIQVQHEHTELEDLFLKMYETSSCEPAIHDQVEATVARVVKRQMQ